MTDSESIKLFCTEWLLQSDCSRGSNCIFIHANMRDITLCDALTDEEVFVKGSYNQGWQRKFKNKRGKPQRHFNTKQNANRDNNTSNRYNTRTNSRLQRQNEANAPSTSTNQHVSPNAASSSTGACKKIKNGKKYSQHLFTSNTSESEDENSKNLPNIQHSVQKDWINSCEFVPLNVKNSISKNEKDKKNECKLVEAATKHAPAKEKKDSEAAGALPDTQEKVCGICFEEILKKTPYERRFGILPNCNHCFCLSCIRKWRQAKQFENNIIRACPECRVTSDFVCPSSYWVETKSAKEELINNYKQALSKKDCKYFRNGNGSCPFGNKCFYRHALTNGTKVDVGPPPSQRYENDLAYEMSLIHNLVLLEYFDSDILNYSSSDDDTDLFDYMLWDSDEDLCLF